MARSFCFSIVFFLFLTFGLVGIVQVSAPDSPSDEEILDAAREIMGIARYCALITLGPEGEPRVRTMDPFPPDRDLTVRLGTNRSTRKVAQIREDSRVALYYFDPKGASYVTIRGNARLIDDPSQKKFWWKENWEEFYEDSYRGEDYVLIEVTPSSCEVVSVEHGIADAPKGWKPAAVVLP